SETNYYYIRILIESLKSDELKLKMIEEIHEEDRGKIIATIKSDDLKLNYIINNREDHYNNFIIAKSIKLDNLKVSLLGLFNEFDKVNIIVTMKSDDMKIDAMKRYLTYFSQREVVESISSIEKKIEAVEFLKFPTDQEEVLKNLKIETDDQRLRLISLLQDERLATVLIEGIENIKRKITAIESIKDETYKKRAILTLDEKYRLNCLSKIKSPFIQDAIIRSIRDENEKIEYIHNSNNEELICKVILTLESDEQRLKQLRESNLTNETNISTIIATLNDDEIKLKQLEKTEDILNATIIQMSLSDREKVKEIFKRPSQKYSKIGLDKNITIGMEIESEGAMSRPIIRIKKLLKRREGEEEIGWETKSDASLKRGVEVVSPILTDNEEDIEDLYIICSMLQRCGNETNERCGGHIHIGANYLKSKEAFINLFEIWGNAEEVICKMSNAKNVVPRFSLQEYARPISPRINKAIEKGSINLESEEDLDSFIEKVQKAQGSRYCGLNLWNINNGKDTIEFRISNGTIDPDTWIENARLYGRIVEIAEKLAEIEKNPIKSNEEK
ncbi:MAG: amidoligase family protein, partial [Fusobacterium sp.]|nr:amidoligase family protein [Fusobacterium sp.]